MMVIYKGSDKRLQYLYNREGSGHVYSAEEQVVGSWIDGKPLYEKTINVGILQSSSQTQFIPHKISDIDIIVKISGFAHRISGNLDGMTVPLPYTVPEAFQSSGQYGFGVQANSENIILMNSVDRSTFNGYITLQYTKTTDGVN